jgi:hypothetical protein
VSPTLTAPLAEAACKRRVEVRCQFTASGSGRRRQRANDQPGPGRQGGESVGAQMLELPAHSIAHYRAADLTPDDKTGSRSAAPGRSKLAFPKVNVGDGEC